MKEGTALNIVDVNCRIGYTVGKIRPAFTQEDLLREMDLCGVDTAVASHNRAAMQLQQGNAMMQEIAAASGGRITACFIVHPCLDDIKMPKDVVAYLSAARPAAVELLPKEHNYPLNERYCGKLLAQLERLRIPLLLQKAQIPNYPDGVFEIADRHPNLPIIMTRQGYPESMFLRTALQTTQNILFNATYAENAAELDWAVKEFGAERFVLGSADDCFASAGLGLVYLGDFSQEAKDAILGGNWKKLQEGIQWA